MRHPLGGIALLLALLAAPVWAQGEDGVESFSRGRPPIVDNLGEDRVVKLTAVNETDGRVVWFNPRLATEMGITLPPGGAMTPELEAELMRNLAWRIPEPGADVSGRRTVDVFADRYGGWGMGYNKGAGRAAFFGEHNLNIKGIGVTPLVSGNTSYSHRHGGAPMTEGIVEAVWGEVGSNLFSRGSTRILAVIDLADYTEWTDGGREHRALIVRSGHQLRPAHILAEGFNGAQNFETLVKMFEATETLVRVVDASGHEVVDLRESLERVADLHARTAAELYRYRILHGGLSPGNKSFDGGMLDLGTVTSQPRTAPVHVLDYTDKPNHVRDDLKFETENTWRIRDLESFKQVLRRGGNTAGYRWSDVDVGRTYEAAYRRHLDLQLLEATGLKPEVAEALRAAEPELVREYTQTIRRLGALTNPVDMNIERGRVERGSVADVFGALRGMPETSFNALADPAAAEARTIALLAIDADRPEQAEKARTLARELSRLHARVLQGAWARAAESYDSRAGFERSVTERAAFENAPLDGLYRSELAPRLRELIDAYEKSGDPTELREGIDRMVDDSRRDVERLMTETASVLPDGALETGVETRDGVRYAVRATADGRRVVRVELPLQPVEGVGYRLTSVAGPDLSGAAAESVDYRYTTDAWGTQGEVRGRVGTGAGGEPALVFEVPVEGGAIRALEGVFHVKNGEAWIRHRGENFRGYRFAAPDGPDLARLKRKVERGETGPGQGFAVRGRGADGPVRPATWSDAELRGLFGDARAAATRRLLERAGTLAEGERAGAAAAAEGARGTELVVELSNDVDARFDRGENAVRITSGLLNAIDDAARQLPQPERAPFRRKALGLILGHELAHAGGVTGERAADLEGVEVARRAAGELSEADARRALEAVARGGSRTLLERVTAMVRYGSEGGRADALAAAARGEADPLARYRRADGTLEWQRVTRDRALREAGGLLHFGLALFLKEVAVVAATGDRARIEEFFDGLATTDFYVNYGLFAAGARVGEVAYVRYLQRYIRPRFVSGLLKTNLVLATGLALPQLVAGTFEGKAFAISLGALGLSSAAVQAGVRSIAWVVDLGKARTAAGAGRTLAAAGRLARLGGWFYSVAELAVVLYVADEVEERVNGWLDLRAARDALGDAADAYGAALRTASTPGQVRAATDAYHQAWTAYRDFLYRPLLEDEARYAQRLTGLARRAKLAADRREAAVARVADQPALRRNAERRYGSLEAYAEARAQADEAELTHDAEAATASYDAARREHLAAVYEAGRRDGALLGGVEELDWLLGGAADPRGDRNDLFARWGRRRSAAQLGDAHRDASTNRLQAYDDEAAVLARAAAAARAAGHADRAAAIDEVLGVVRTTRALDQELQQGSGPIQLDSPGILGALERAGG